MLSFLRSVARCCGASTGNVEFEDVTAMTPRGTRPANTEAAAIPEEATPQSDRKLLDPARDGANGSVTLEECLQIMERTQRELKQTRDELRSSRDLLREALSERDELARRVQLLRLVNSPLRVSRSDLASLGSSEGIKEVLGEAKGRTPSSLPASGEPAAPSSFPAS
eukprot:tig00020562_g11163.t1